MSVARRSLLAGATIATAGLRDRAEASEPIGEGLVLGSVPELEAAAIPASKRWLRLEGARAPGDGGANALYVKVEAPPRHGGVRRSQDGAWWELRVQRPNPYHFMAYGNGKDPDNEALRAWLAYPRAVVKELPQGRFKVTELLRGRPGDSIIGTGEASVIDALSMTPTDAGEVIRFDGRLEPIASLTADVALGDVNLPLAEPGLRAGDAILIFDPADYSWLPHRFEYRRGEWCRVHDVVGTSVQLMAPLYASYPASAVKLYKLVGAQTIVRDFRVELPPLKIGGLRLDLIDRPIVSNVFCPGSTSINVLLNRCLDISVDSYAFQKNQGEAWTDYGLVISSCQGGSVRGVYNARRHGVAIGCLKAVGSVPNRAIDFDVSMQGNHYNAGAQDLHGCAEDLRFKGGSISNGAVIGGKSIKFLGQRYRNRLFTSTAYGSEIKGGDFLWEGCSFEQYRYDTERFFPVVDVTLYRGDPHTPFNERRPLTFEPITLSFRNCHFRVPAGMKFAVRVAVQGWNAPVRILLDGITVEGGESLTHFLRLERKVAVPSSIDRIDLVEIGRIFGLPPRCRYAENVGPELAVAQWKLPEQGGSLAVPVTAGAASQRATVQFPVWYPSSFKPRVTFARIGDAPGEPGTVVETLSRDAASATVLLKAGGGKFLSNAAIEVDWSARG